MIYEKDRILTLERYAERMANDPFNFDGDKHLIVPKRLLGSEIFNSNIDELSKDDLDALGDLDKREYLSNQDLREGELFHMAFGTLFNSRIGIVRGKSQIGTMRGTSIIGEVTDYSYIVAMYDTSIIELMNGNSFLNEMGDYSKVQQMLGNSIVNTLFQFATIEEMEQQSQVKELDDYSVVSRMSDSAVVWRRTKDAKINECVDNAKTPEHKLQSGEWVIEEDLPPSKQEENRQIH